MRTMSTVNSLFEKVYKQTHEMRQYLVKLEFGRVRNVSESQCQGMVRTKLTIWEKEDTWRSKDLSKIRRDKEGYVQGLQRACS